MRKILLIGALALALGCAGSSKSPKVAAEAPAAPAGVLGASERFEFIVDDDASLNPTWERRAPARLRLAAKM